MAITPINGSALQGISRGLQGMRRSAAEIAHPAKDSVRALVELHQHAQHTSASVKVLQTADQVIGSLLDVKA
ncbi:MAG: hypothetical protein KDI68_05340 [Gammaproteobacteria bacterium]|nr:hypothetical protein [Gammaproteobacteria bacterium]